MCSIKYRYGQHIVETGWTIVYPTGMVDKPARGTYREGERLSIRGFAFISRGDVAAFLLKQVEDTTYMRKNAVISW
jgi:hypothetical protein